MGASGQPHPHYVCGVSLPPQWEKEPEVRSQGGSNHEPTAILPQSSLVRRRGDALAAYGGLCARNPYAAYRFPHPNGYPLSATAHRDGHHLAICRAIPY